MHIKKVITIICKIITIKRIVIGELFCYTIFGALCEGGKRNERK